MRSRKNQREVAYWIFKIGVFGVPAVYCLYLFRDTTNVREIANSLLVAVIVGAVVGALGAFLYLRSRQ